MRAIAVAALVAESERPIVSRAVAAIARAVADASHEPIDGRCRFLASANELAACDGREIVVVSLLREVDRDEPWTDTERRLRAQYATLAERDVPAFVCTVFRHVARRDDVRDDGRLERIRRLDLLAMELSHATGAYVIDLDRALADIGARPLATDYRLGGENASALAAHVVARAIVADALDGIVSVEVQDAAAAMLDATRPIVHDAHGTYDASSLPGAVAAGYGRRNRAVKPVLVTVQASRVDIAVRDVVRGSIGPRTIGSRLLRALRQRGFRTTTRLLATGLARHLRSRR